MKKILLLLFLIFVGQINAQVCIGTPTYYTTGNSPSFATVGDFNGDGKQDIAEVNKSSNNIYVRLGNGAGNFAVADSFNLTGGGGPLGIVSNDFNGDGKLDLATANYNSFSGNISVLLGNGNGSFGLPTNFNAGFGPACLVVADFNEDGFIDLAVGNGGGGGGHSFVSVLIGNGNGSFNNPTSFNVGTGGGSGYANPWSITKADLNKDGHADVITGNASDNTISVLLGTGSGSLGNATNIAVGTSPYSVCSADFNGDGNSDVAVAIGIGAGISILLGDGAGNLSSPASYPLAANHASSVIPLDYNNDGLIDLAVTFGTYPGMVGVLAGDGTGSFSSYTTYTLTSSAYTGPVVAADFNGDSKIDLALLLYWSNQLAVLLNCTNIGIEKFSDQQKISFYPNPTTGKFIIETNSTEKQNIQLFDINGRLVLQQTIQPIPNPSRERTAAEIDARNLDNGIYNLTVKSSSGITNKKLVLTR
jgi:hypothetical protein